MRKKSTTERTSAADAAIPAAAESSGGVSDDAPPAGDIFAVDYDGHLIAVVRAATATDAVERTVSMVDCSCRERLDPRRLSAREPTEAELDRRRRHDRDHLLDCPVGAAAAVAPGMRIPPVGFPGAARRRDRQRRNARAIALAIVGVACFTAAGMAAVGVVSGYFDDGAQETPTRTAPKRQAGRSIGASGADPAGAPNGPDVGNAPPPGDGVPNDGLPAPPSSSGADGGPTGSATSYGSAGMPAQFGGPVNAAPPLVLRGSSGSDARDGPPVVVPPPGAPLTIGEGTLLGDFGTGRPGIPPGTAPRGGPAAPQIALLPPLPPGNSPGGTAGNGNDLDGPSPKEGGTGGTEEPTAGDLPPGGGTTSPGTGDPPGGGGGPVVSGDPSGPGGTGSSEGGPDGNAPSKDPPPGKPGPGGGPDAPITIDEPPVWAILALAISLLAAALRLRRRLI